MCQDDFVPTDFLYTHQACYNAVEWSQGQAIFALQVHNK